MTGSLLSTPHAADFGPEPEAAAERVAAGRDISIYTSDFGPGPDAATKGVEAPLSWTESLLFPRLAADLGSDPEAAAEGGGAGRGVCSLRLSPPTSGLARRRRRRGAQLGGKFALYASRRRLRAWPGEDGGLGGGPQGGEAGREDCLYASRRRLRAAESGLARRRRRRGAARRSWTGGLLSTPRSAADFLPGRRRRRRGSQLDGS